MVDNSRTRHYSCKLVFFTLCAALLLGQQSTPKFEFCGLGSHRECSCIRHTQSVRQKFIDNCERTSTTTKERDNCLAHMPAHCDLADRYSDFDENNENVAVAIPMSERCSMACKKSDCKCDDGPVCHFAHTPADHQPGANKDKP